MGILTNIGVAIIAVVVAAAFIYQPTTLPNLPPGSTGYPLIGETINLFQQPQSWFVERMIQDGPLSKTFFLGQDLILLMGKEGASLFYDTSRITRVDADPHYTYAALPNNIAYQDEHGAQFKLTKKLLLHLTEPAEIEKFFPTYIQQTQAFFANLSTSYHGASFCLEPHLKTFFARVLGTYMFGSPDPEWVDKFLYFYLGLTQPPVQIPSSAFSKAVNTVPTLIAWYTAQVAAHRAHPSDYDDALSRLLHDPESSQISDDQLAYELHATMASAFRVFSVPTNLVYTLALYPDITKSLRTEIKSHTSTGPFQLSQLSKYTYLDQLVKESQRYNWGARIQFARVRETFNYTVKATGRTYTLYKGFPVALPFHTVHKDPSVYTNPETFQPERFKDADDKYNEESLTLIPNGGGNPKTHHTCIGVQLTRILTKGVAIVLFGEYDWTVGFPHLGFFMGMATPTPTDHLYIHKFRQL